jgi:hypothetical protein
MEQILIMSHVQEKHPARPLNDGYLDDVFAIFEARQRHLVLIEVSALRWTGLRVCSEEVNLTFLS